jgi:hypothetical protein
MFSIIDIQITDGSTEPINLAAAKSYCRVTSEDDDALITDLTTIARQKIERFTSRSLVAKTIILTIEANEAFPLPYPKINQLTTVKVYRNQNPDGSIDWETLTGDDYKVLGNDIKTFYPPYDGLYEITYTTTANTDKSLLHDLKRVLLWLYENLGDDADNMPVELMSNAKHLKVLTWV